MLDTYRLHHPPSMLQTDYYTQQLFMSFSEQVKRADSSDDFIQPEVCLVSPAFTRERIHKTLHCETLGSALHHQTSCIWEVFPNSYQPEADNLILRNF